MNTPTPASGSSGFRVNVRDCTTRQSKTHSTETREVSYPWHPWYESRVLVEEIFDKKSRRNCRSRLEDSPESRALEIPSWMLEASWRQTRLSEEPAVDGDALRKLEFLVGRVSGRGRESGEASAPGIRRC